MGLRQQKRARTETAITEVAYRLFEERGFEATTVEMIAEQVSISARTVYRYFETKEDIVFARVVGEGDVVARGIRSRCRGDVTLESVLEAWAQHLSRRHRDRDFIDLIRLTRSEGALVARTHVWRAGLASDTAKAVADVRGKSDVGVEERGLASVVIAMTATALDEWVSDRSDEDPGDILRQLADHVVRPPSELAS